MKCCMHVLPTFHSYVFRCACYPHFSQPKIHKLSAHSTFCAFLGYASNYKGYYCYDSIKNKVYILCHVTLKEDFFAYLFLKLTSSLVVCLTLFNFDMLYNLCNFPTISSPHFFFLLLPCLILFHFPTKQIHLSYSLRLHLLLHFLIHLS